MWSARFVIIALSTGTVLAEDAWTPVSQQRTLLVMADASPCENPSNSLNLAADDFAPLSVMLEDAPVCAGFGAIARAEQDSTIDAHRLAATGQTQADTINPNGAHEFILAFSDSNYDVEFEVANAICVQFTGQLDAQAHADTPPSFSAQARVKLDQGPAQIIDRLVVAAINQGPVAESIDASLVLQPGQYRLRASSDAVITDAFPTSGQTIAGYDVVLTPASAGDLNCDGATDVIDLADLIFCHRGPNQPPPDGCAGAIFADIDRDGDVDLLDYAGFQVEHGASTGG